MLLIFYVGETVILFFINVSVIRNFVKLMNNHEENTKEIMSVKKSVYLDTEFC